VDDGPAEVDQLLGSGSPVRQVARLTGFPRATLVRHRDHANTATSEVRRHRGAGTDAQVALEPAGPVDPLSAGYELAATAKTERERIKSLEAIRGATKLLLTGAADLDDEQRDLLDRSILAASVTFRASSTFDNQTRALQGLREAIRHRLDAVPAPDAITVLWVATLADGTPLEGTLAGPTVEVATSPADYWHRVPSRFRDLERYVVNRSIALAFVGGGPRA
jgi:hypothetical protein